MCFVFYITGLPTGHSQVFIYYLHKVTKVFYLTLHLSGINNYSTLYVILLILKYQSY